MRTKKGKIVDFLINNWMLLLVAIGSGVMLFVPGLSASRSGGGISIADAVHKMNREKAVMIDVRSEAAYNQARVAQSKHVPLSELGAKLPQVVKKKDQPVLLLCETGRSASMAVAAVKKLGYEQVYSVAGGLRAWKAANMPVSETKAA